MILDGENCWEYYPDGGIRFLRALYRGCVQHSQIRPQRVRDYLKEQPATDRIGNLFAGSWISHNFAIWIGHHEDNTAWDLLHQTREFLKQTEAEGKAPRDALAKAWEELFIAEGSDWFWWFGDDHSSSQDALFDQLFRKHLQNVYTRLEAVPPNVLKHPIKRLQRRALHTRPTGFCPVKVDGRRTYFEWICAGHYVCGSERGTMTKVTQGVMRAVYFGFDAQRLALRVDTARYAREDLEILDELRCGSSSRRCWKSGSPVSGSTIRRPSFTGTTSRSPRWPSSWPSTRSSNWPSRLPTWDWSRTPRFKCTSRPSPASKASTALPRKGCSK